MKFEVTDINSVKKNITVTVPSEEVNAKLAENLAEVSKTASIKGFRAGKIPPHMIEKLFGSSVRKHTAQELVKEYITKALDEAGISPVVPPLVDPGDAKKDADFVFTAELELLPPIEKVNMDGIEIEVPKAEAAEEEIEHSIENLRMGAATVKMPDSVRPVQTGDYVLVDFEAKTSDKLLSGQKNVGVEVGSGHMPPEFEDALIGMNAGEKKTITTKYPEGADPSVAGKEITFDVFVKEIKERILPKLDDEFAKDLGRESMTALRDSVKERICKMKEDESKEKTRREIMAKLREKNPIELPPTVVEEQRLAIIRETRERFQKMKLPFKENQFSDEFVNVAKDRVHEDILLNAIADSNNIEITDEELDKEVEGWAVQAQQDAEKLKAALIHEGRIESVRYGLRKDKTLDFLMSSVTIKCVSEEGVKSDANASEPTSEKEK